MHFKTAFMLALAFVLAACAGGRQVTARYSAADIAAKEKGLAIYSIQQDIFLEGITEITLTWLGPDGREILFGHNARVDSETLGNGAILQRYTSFLPPGEYKLKKFSMRNSLPSFSRSQNSTVDFAVGYEAGFTITPGTITYLGNIIVQTPENKGFSQPEGAPRILVTEEPAKIIDYLNKFKKDTGWPARLQLIDCRPRPKNLPQVL